MFIIIIIQFVSRNHRYRHYFLTHKYPFIVVNLFKSSCFFSGKSVFELIHVDEISPLMSAVFIALSGFRR